MQHYMYDQSEKPRVCICVYTCNVDPPSGPCPPLARNAKCLILLVFQLIVELIQPKDIYSIL